MRYLRLFNKSYLAPFNCTSKVLALPTPVSSRIFPLRFLSEDSSAPSSSSSSQSPPQSAPSFKYDPTQSRSDMEELFLDSRVRNLLKRLTGFNPKSVFASISLDNLNQPQYRFLTDEQMRMEKEETDQKAEKMLQMPPVKYSKEYEPTILEEDIALQGFLDPSVKVILMDATPGYSDVERLIVVREADGTLREANREERHRTNQIFYPVEERQIELPKMLEDPHTENVLNRGGYKLLLNNACLHLDPDDSRYIDLCHRTYDHIASKHAFDSLLSTRFYGGMVFYFVYYRRADALLHYLVTENQLEYAFHLLQLYYIVNPREGVPVEWNEDLQTDISLTKLAEISQNRNRLTSVSLEQFINLFKFYITNDSTNVGIKPRLQLNIQKLQQQLLDETEDSASAQN